MNLPVNTPWPRALKVVALEHRRLWVQMSDGRQILLDLSTLVQHRDAYWRLRQDRYFRQVGIDPLGGIFWPEGEDLDPEGLDRYDVTRGVLAASCKMD